MVEGKVEGQNRELDRIISIIAAKNREKQGQNSNSGGAGTLKVLTLNVFRMSARAHNSPLCKDLPERW